MALLLWIIFVISGFFLLCFRARLFIDALWSPGGKGLVSWLSFVMSNCEVPIGILGQVWCLIVSISDLCPFSYFYLVRVFSDVLVAFLYFDIVAKIKIWKSHLNIREGSD